MELGEGGLGMTEDWTGDSRVSGYVWKLRRCLGRSVVRSVRERRLVRD